ncbi:hypothetical protein ACHAW5_010882 [Stephanodiscus triporus]|uniref:Nuclear pore complex protein n=1 Tax=Stephanodiscus triporus TaxID=2934178 RepID=A0ABD3MH94_9STRA
MASNNDPDEDDGVKAYNLIQAELGQWGLDFTPTSTPRRYSAGFSQYYDETPAPASTTTPATTTKPASSAHALRIQKKYEDDMEEEDGSPSPGTGRHGPVGIQTPEPPRRQAPMTDEQALVETTDEDMDAGRLIDDGMDSYRPYHDALYAYLQSKERLSKFSQRANDYSAMQIDGDEAVMGEQDDEGAHAAQSAMKNAEVTFLESLASICLSRVSGIVGGISLDGGNIWSEASKNEGNLWDLLAALRAECVSSLFYCVNGEELPDLILSNDPASMVDSAPADVLDACLGGGVSLPLQRLNAALGWIEACHGRRFEEALNQEYEGNADPLLPPPRRRTMWPGTLAALQKQRRSPSTSGAFHPDAPLQIALGTRSSSPVDVLSSLMPQDEMDDARLLRACFMLFQAGRVEEAVKLVTDCGQPWRAASWTGWEPLSADGAGNPTRALWKRKCRKILKKMAELVNMDSTTTEDTGMRGLYPSIAYEAAILSLLSDDVDAALNNPVFQTWEDGVCAILRAEVGIIQDDVLRSHHMARVEFAEGSGGHFPFPGTEFESYSRDMDDAPHGNWGDLAAALEKLDASPIAQIREDGGDPFRNGMISVLVGQNALKEYIEECAILSLETESNDEACFLRFITHLVLYVGTVLPEFCSRLSLPPGIDAATDSNISSLHELLILKYVAHLSSRRDLWPYVALYSSLLSTDNIIDTYSSFLIRVHSDRERQMFLNQARELFPKGFDCYILRYVVRGMIMCDANDWTREPGEEAAPLGVSPADARMMRSIHWFCYYPEHRPDALVAVNMLLRKFLLRSKSDTPDKDLYAAKLFIDRILPRDLIDVAVDQCQKKSQAIAGSISLSLVQNLEVEYLSIQGYLKAHTQYTQFLNDITKTSPCHKSNKLVGGAQSKHESEIADKMERNNFRHKKMGLCKIVIESASRVSDSLMDVLTFAGGWLIDANSNLDNEETESEEAKSRSEELEMIRNTYVPRAVFMLHEVFDKTAMWLEQIVHDTVAQFGSAGKEMLLTLYGSFDESDRTPDNLSMDSLSASRAAPGYWHKKSLSLASVVANDGNGLHEALNNAELESFLKLMAESHISLSPGASGAVHFGSG